MPETLAGLAKKANVSEREAENAWKRARENCSSLSEAVRETKRILGVLEEDEYDEFYWMRLSEAHNFGKKILKFLEKRAKTKEDTEDLDDDMADEFHIKPETAGEIIADYVRFRAGGMNEKDFIRKADARK